MGAIAARAAIERANVPAAAVDHVVFGNVLQSSSNAAYAARHIGLKAGLPVEVPALTVNRLCGSGIQAAISGEVRYRYAPRSPELQRLSELLVQFWAQSRSDVIRTVVMAQASSLSSFSNAFRLRKDD